MDLIAQHFAYNDLFWGMGFGTALALPQFQKHIVQALFPVRPTGDDTNSYSASPDGTSACSGRPYSTITISMTETITSTAPEKPFTEWSTTTEEKTMWRTDTTTATTYSSVFTLTTPMTTTQYLPKATVTQTEWKKLRVTEYVTPRPAVETVYSDSGPPASTFSFNLVRGTLVSSLIATLVLMSLALFALIRRVIHLKSRDWYRECTALMRQSVVERVKAERERDYAQASRDKAIKDAVKKKDWALDRMRNQIVEMEGLEPEAMETEDFELDEAFDEMVKLWKMHRKEKERQLRDDVFIETLNSMMTQGIGIETDYHRMYTQLRQQYDELRKERDGCDGSYVNGLVEQNSALKASNETCERRIQELEKRLARSGGSDQSAGSAV
tara:strand:- start:1901 stop:3052 length:1152 start_codon:yes stop_codon:yes gene_type:complete